MARAASTSGLAARLGLGRLKSGGSGFAAFLERKLSITLSGFVLALVAVAGWIVARLIGNAGMFQIVYGLAVLFILSVVLGRRRLTVEATRSDLPSRVRQGQTVEVTVQLKAKRRLSTIVMEETLHHHLGRSVGVPVPLLPSGEVIEHTYTFEPQMRGVFEVGPLMATWSDPFGLTRRRARLLEPTQIIVHPSTEMVHDRVISREWEDPPIRPPLSKPWPTGFEFYGMRDYVNGDDPRRIIWRAVARLGRYVVKESEQGITDRVTIIMDTDRTKHSPGEVSETFETAVRVAASLGAKHLEDGFSVSLDLNSGRVASGLRGSRKRITLLDELARANREPDSIAQGLGRIVTGSGRDRHNVLITPHLDEDAAKRVQILLDRGAHVMIVLVVWEDSDPQALHRAALLGTNIVEVNANSPLEATFRRVVSAGSRKW